MKNFFVHIWAVGLSLLIPLLTIAVCQAQSNIFPDDGNVGIGTIWPNYNLDIRTAMPGIRMMESTSGGNRRLHLEVGRNNEIRFLSTFGTGGNYPFTFHFGAFGEAMRIATNGNVGIGTTNPKAKLAVEGNILAKEIKVKTDISVPDYVFEPEYELTSLKEIEAYVKEHKHLPEVPSAAEVERDGLNLAEMNLLLLKKVEELTLHLIEKDRQLQHVTDRLGAVEERLYVNTKL